MNGLTAVELLTHAENNGLRVSVRDGDLVIRCPARLRSLAEALIARKTDVLVALRSREHAAAGDTTSEFTKKTGVVSPTLCDLANREAVAACIDPLTGWAEITLPGPDGDQRICGEPWAVEAAARDHLEAAALRRRTEGYFREMLAVDRAWLGRPMGEPCPWCRLRSGHSARCREQSAGWAMSGTMPVGMYRGRLLARVPTEYLDWALSNMGDALGAEAREAIRATLTLRRTAT